MICDGCGVPRAVDFLHLPPTLLWDPHPQFFYNLLMNEVAVESYVPSIKYLSNVLVHYLLMKY